jgi:5,10-methylene-tetrahydrofolate dehydrogenase/methenyl tetrahydrofolate cyclohydrolase
LQSALSFEADRLESEEVIRKVQKVRTDHDSSRISTFPSSISILAATSLELMNTVAIVTGSSQGIGQAIARRLAQDGINIAIDYHTHAEGAEETLRQVEAAGAKGVIVKADLSLLSEINHLVEQTLATFGRIDIL